MRLFDRASCRACSLLEECRQKINMDRIPVIDIAPFLSGTPEGRAGVPAAIRKAAEEIGFFAIVGHGVPRTTMDALYETAHAFFDLPLEEKQRVAPPRPD